ncbi:hypothetical protein TCAL_16636 [Tigriopus californicus]|uniref:Uncharacterized protein n=1 Tax=Tigriopus californicus TaxID=6832 RepID=A0A553NB45_TIGCA|nr:hypothetical protein TCAL_16636 [Tigriopus californicus]
MSATGFLSTGSHRTVFKRAKTFAPTFNALSSSRSSRNSVESSPDSSEDSGENDDKFESTSSLGLARPEKSAFSISRRRPKSLIFLATTQDLSEDHINFASSKWREKRRHLSPPKLCSIPENDSVQNDWLDLHSSLQSAQGNLQKRRGMSSSSQCHKDTFARRYQDELESSTGHRSPVSIENGYRPFSSSPNAQCSFPVINDSSMENEQKDVDDRFLVQGDGFPLSKHENQSFGDDPVHVEVWQPKSELQHWLSFVSDFALSLICLVIAVPAILLLYDHYMKQRNPFV